MMFGLGYNQSKLIIENVCRNAHKYFQRKMTLSSSFIDIHPEVNEALATNKPIVALESTVITHGMPHPLNLETALEVEDIVRNEGVIPATIAVIDGRVKIGLTRDQFQRLSSLSQDVSIKCSRRDLAYVTSKKLCGGTTVAGTMIAAKMAGIRIFSTGGIGGVHRNGHESLDISADLVELGRTPVTVVSAGIKSILDIPRTLEYLETQGVCVASYRSTGGNFPAFYSRSSGVKAPYNLNDPIEAANLIYSSTELKLESGILIAVPIPSESAIPDDEINEAINDALFKAKEQNICGKAVTPFLLEAVSKITKGRSLQANIALLKNNAKVASQISVQLSKLLATKMGSPFSNVKEHNLTKTKSNNDINNIPVVIGASILDLTLTINDEELKITLLNVRNGLNHKKVQPSVKSSDSIIYLTSKKLTFKTAIQQEYQRSHYFHL